MAEHTDSYKHDILWQFSVTDPRLHSKGFTVYKIACKSFHAATPELLTEIVCWKRYNEFHTLYKSLLVLHRTHHKTDPFPEFAKPKFFGRFSDAVIEKRRQSAAELLNFISSQPHLYKSSLFLQFLEEGRIQSDFNKRAANISIISSGLTGEAGSKGSDLPTLSTAKLPVQACEAQDIVGEAFFRKQEEIIIIKQDQEESQDGHNIKQPVLAGTWQFPQVADSISLGSSTGEDAGDTDDESSLAFSLPDPGVDCYNSYSTGPLSPTPVTGGHSSQSRNSGWLQEGFSACVLLGSHTSSVTSPVIFTCSTEDIEATPVYMGESTLDTQSSIVTGSSVNYRLSSANSPAGQTLSSRKGAADEFVNVDEPDPLGRMSQSSTASKTECGRGDLDLSAEFQMRQPAKSLDNVTCSNSSRLNDSQKQHQNKRQINGMSTLTKPVRSSSGPADVSDVSDQAMGDHLLLGHSTSSFWGGSTFLRPRSVTDQSVSTMSIGGKDDYIFRAANQICKAQNCEVNGDFDTAFAYYKSGVGILLNGVQGDTNKFRRDAVRRKTAKYLMKAEDLYNRHLANDNISDMRWGMDNFLSPSLDPSFAFIRGSVKELQNFQVLSCIDKVVLVRHKITDETFVIKSLSKSMLDPGFTSSVLPTSCPFMVSLRRFYETEDSVFLLLQYASGGKLWNYIKDYLNTERKRKVNRKVNCNTILPKRRLTVSGTKPSNISEIKHLKQDYLSLHTDCKFVLEKDDRIRGQSCDVERTPSELPFRNQRDVINSSEADGLKPKCLQETKDITEQDNICETLKNVIADDSFKYVNSFTGTNSVIKSLEDSECFKDVPSSQGLTEESTFLSEIDHSQASIISSPEDQSFHSLLREKCVSVEAFSINSQVSLIQQSDSSSDIVDISFGVTSSEPNHVSENVSATCTLPTNINSGVGLLTSDFNTCADKFLSSEDLINQSKQLITEVQKVLFEANEGANFCLDNSVKPETVCDKTTLTVKEKTLIGDSLTLQEKDHVSNCDPNLSNISDTEGSCSLFFNSSNTPFETCPTEDLSRSQPEITSSSLSKGPRAAIFRQTSTPRKLSLAQTSCTGLRRSMSYECDLRSPTHSRTKTLSDSFQQLDSFTSENVHIPDTLIRKWVAQMVTAVSRLHSLGVVCRDLKPSNILLGDKGQVYLTYFCHLGYDHLNLDWEAKDNLYAAPEVGSAHTSDRACDWWSIGALLYELVVGRSLVECHPGGINSHTCLYMPAFVESETRALLEGLLCYNPSERLGAGMAGSEEIKSHPFFAGIDWHGLEYS